MSKLNRFVLSALVLFVLAVVALGLGRNALLGTAAIRAVRDATGLEMRIERINAHWVRPTIEIDGLVVGNPPGFPESDALNCTRILARYDRTSLFSNELRFPEMEVQIGRVTVVYDTNGVMNLRRLAEQVSEHRKAHAIDAVASSGGGGGGGGHGGGGGGGGGGRASASPETPSGRGLRIDRLTVAVDAIEVRDFSSGGAEPETRNATVGIRHTMTNVTDLARAGREVGVLVGVAAAPVLIRRAEDAFKLLGADAKQADKAADQLKEQARDLKKMWDQFRGKSRH